MEYCLDMTGIVDILCYAPHHAWTARTPIAHIDPGYHDQLTSAMPSNVLNNRTHIAAYIHKSIPL